ncbi:hypothetical protein [Methylobacter tundripaludum]|uniref:DUF3077 family protein n=1 Tax=Methylobacter tundripaludum (strain ATCC BAA-1195 / DSM 17260 / SV96) TaxID=697282 RepID=G3ISD8_METTV|nr:hypothetical protein [Methylobacter tundripaludum]EGW22308.1 hypothetical protein Mettu_1116 [Methylobacter tundripaludum SV96]
MNATTEQTDTQATPKIISAFDTKFPHRVNAGIDNTFFNLIDTVNPSLARARALADLLEIAGEVADKDSFEDGTIWHVAQTIRFEILDAQTLLKAYVDEKRV